MQLLAYAITGASPAVVYSGLMLLMPFLTNVISNNAAAVLGTPITASVARQLDLPSRALVLAVSFNPCISSAMLIGYETSLSVISAGGSRFSDFMRVGVPLMLVAWPIMSWFLPIFYEFKGRYALSGACDLQ